jgi:transketolase
MEDTVSDSLAEKARALRVLVLQMIHDAPQSHPGHPGGSLSAAEIVAALYFGVMNVRPNEPGWPDRDRFVLAKGHCAPVVYAALAERGFFPKSWLGTLRRPGSMLQGHPDMRKTPGIDMSTGSLGQGLSAAVGMALAGKMDRSAFRVFALLSDGELDEGQTWEAAMTAHKYNLGNLMAVVDVNGLQNDGFTRDIMPLGDLRAKWAAFGWGVIEVDGHDTAALLAALQSAHPGTPRAVLARTTKGKGVSFMENRVEWHAGAISDAQLAEALKGLGQAEGPP